MGYESRIYVVQKSDFIDPDNSRWAEIITSYNMRKYPPLDNHFRTCKDTDVYIFDNDGNTKIVTDKYDKPLKESTIEDTTIASFTTTEKITLDNNQLKNTKISLSTWGCPTEVLLKNNTISIDKDSLLHLSAGVTKEVILDNNTIENNSNKSLINLFDTSYTKAKGKLILKNNTINQGNSDYIFDGVKIESGEFDFIYNNNHINGAKLINPIYKQMKCFNVQEK